MELVERVLKGDTRAVARAITEIENGSPAIHDILKSIYPRTGRTKIIGVTGPFGVGKSSLINKLAAEYRKRDQKIGIVAVDPTSSFSGGAILGDRIRMHDHFLDPGIFIRSMATRGQMGGLAKATGDVVDVLDAAGFDVVIVETVGVGQDEVEIVNLAHTNMVILVPGLGDDIQTFKAGLMEIADIFIINKIDLGNWELVKTQIEMMLSLAEERKSWRPVIVETIANDGTGIGALVEQIEAHQAYFKGSPEKEERELKKSRQRLKEILTARIWETLTDVPANLETVESLVRKVIQKSMDPYSAAEYLAGHVLQLKLS
jgi:LAO/AO transport system kinase